ncbi:MAG: outer membrane lipoprotein carrier protein LolA [Saprospiraceae bacterium]
MKNKQPIIRLCLSIFFVFGMFQTAFSQSIDSMSKVILEQFEEKYAAYETMSFQMQMILPIADDIDTNIAKVDFNHQHMRVEHEEALIITDGKEDAVFGKQNDYTSTDEHDKSTRLVWLFKFPDFCREYCEVTYRATNKIASNNSHILNIKILNDNSSVVIAKYFLDANSLEIQKIMVYFDKDQVDVGVLTIEDFQFNPTFEEDYFEIKE